MNPAVPHAAALRLKGLKKNIEHHISNEPRRPAKARLRTKTDKGVGQPVSHDTHIPHREIRLNAVINTDLQIVVENINRHLIMGSVPFQNGNAIAKTSDKIMLDDVARPSQHNSIPFIIAVHPQTLHSPYILADNDIIGEITVR